MPGRTAAISSGNRKTDKFFEKIIKILNSDKVEEIVLVKKLWDYGKNKKKEYLYGLVDDAESEDNYIICLSNDKKKRETNDIAKTLLHEVLHIIYMKKRELQILALEDYWWNKFSKGQKNILRTYVPKRARKYKPSI